MRIFKAYKFRLYPTTEKEISINKNIGLLQIEYYFFIIRVNKETINKMIINIRNTINKSFFFIIVRPPFIIVIRKSASTQQLVFPVSNISISGNIVHIFSFNCIEFSKKLS